MVSAVQEGADKPKPNPKEPKEQNHLELVSMTIQPGEEMIVGQRVRAILASARKGNVA
jgi:L-seryl-tRNA(Ser) seleniumtransferase